LINRLNAWLEWYAIRNCDRLLTVSRSLRREMLRLGVPRTKLSVVPNGVPVIEPISTGARIHRDAWTIGMIALMRPRKGVEVAMQAMRELKTNGVRNVTLELIGSFESEPYEQQILSEINRLGLGDTIRWSGFTDDVPAALNRLDALLLPSLFGEGMPMVVLEALSAGVPVVATRVEGTPEVVRDGVEGYLAEPRDSHSLATCIGRLISDRETWSELSRNAVKRHRENFSDQRMAVATASAYRKLLAAHRGGQPSSG
jgi:glycosyltransferase involved in cell wall biosynthesis